MFINKVLATLASPSSYSSLHDRSINTEVVRARNSDFSQKASRLKRWWTSVPNDHLTQVRIQISFILKELP